MMKPLRTVFVILPFVAWVATATAQQPGPPPEASGGAASTDFLKAADEVMAEMSKILLLPQRVPLKRSLRPREEIRAYVLRQVKEDKDPAERYAAQRVLEKFGLIPKGFDIEPFLVELLAEQIAGLYDPKEHEFYIADWIGPAEQNTVMAHELAHALEDQHFGIEKWMKAARPNDDAQLAREAVLEGTALAAMVDYMLRGTGRGARDLPEIDPELFMGSAASSPVFSKAPPFLQHLLLFPYVSGLNFSQQFLKQSAGWSDLHKLFENPPLSTQQVLHPGLYARGLAPKLVELPARKGILAEDWKRLEENILGEFALREVLQQYLDKDRAARLAPAWAGDCYALYEQAGSLRLLLIFRLRLASPEDAARFFGNYSEVLERKHDRRSDLFRRPNFFSFGTPDEGGVFLRCVEEECLVAEGAGQAVFDRLAAALGWPPGPVRPKKPERIPERIARAPRQPLPSFSSAGLASH